MRFEDRKEAGYQLDKMLNRGLRLEDNFQGGWIEFVTTATVQEVHHNLGYPPQTFFLGFRDGQVSLWAENPSAWDKVRVYFGSDQAGRRVRVFLH